MKRHLLSLRAAIDSYSPISDATWAALKKGCSFARYGKGDTLLRLGDCATALYFIGSGLLRTYFIDEEGNLYNKNLFPEHTFAGSKASMLQGTPSEFAIEALEETEVVVLEYRHYRALIDTRNDLKDFYIAYLEQKWVIERERLEIALVLDDATTRYLAFLEKYPDIEKRVSQHHIAAHLGITPTQLSRIRRNLKTHQPM
ncbi:Crp/Fnr family transcriptional regulator [Thiomicrolovo sp. ZZH C-3]